MGWSNDVVDNSITGPPPEELDEGDGKEPPPAGILTLFNASLYFLNKIVLFLVAIENNKSHKSKKKKNYELQKII